MDHDFSEFVESIISRGCLFAFSVCIIIHACRRVVRQDKETTPELEESVQNLTWCHIIAFPILGSLMLLIMFYFFEYVQLMLALLTLVLSTVTLSIFINPFVFRILSTLNCQRQGRVGVSSIDWTAILTIIVAVVISIVWLMTNHWILLDLVGVASATFMILFIRLPSLKVATIFMILLLIYDVFWVFASPSLFQSNVMVEVAQKRAVNPIAALAEKINMPALTPSEPLLSLPGKLIIPSSFSNGGYSMLGLGDVVLPGMLVCLAMRFDAIQEPYSSGSGRYTVGSNCFLRCQRSSYFLVSIAGYSIGLFIAGMVVELFQYPQPALLYLVPGVLIPIISKAYVEGHFYTLWQGPTFNTYSSLTNNSKLSV